MRFQKKSTPDQFRRQVAFCLGKDKIMHIGVLGAGVIGVTTAYALTNLGHHVTLIDKNSDVAHGASYANGAQLSFSYVDPLASPQTFRSLPSYLLGLDPAMKVTFSLKPDFLKWGIKFLRECSTAKTKANFKARANLSVQSQRAYSDLHTYLNDKTISKRPLGKIVLVKSEKDLEALRQSAGHYHAHGLERDILGRNDAIEVEPALGDINEEFAGAMYAKSDTALDSLVFCRVLKSYLIRQGAIFRFNETAQSLTVDGGQVTGIQTDSAHHTFDRIVVCTGIAAPKLLSPLGVSVPIFPIQGYSLTLPASEHAPSASVTSLKHKTVFARLESTIRIAGFADLNQHPTRQKERAQQLLKLVKTFWPSIADYSADPNIWTGYRPMTPSGVPIIGDTKCENLLVNVGHGSLGYTFAMGSAIRIAKIIGPATDTQIQNVGGQNYAAQ